MKEVWGLTEDGWSLCDSCKHWLNYKNQGQKTKKAFKCLFYSRSLCSHLLLCSFLHRVVKVANYGL